MTRALPTSDGGPCAGRRLRTGRRSLRAALGAGLLAFALATAARADESARELLVKAGDQLEAWDIDGAAAVLREMESHAPGEPETLWVQGRVLFEQGDYDGAVRALEAAKAKGAGVQSIDEDLRLAENAGEEVRGAKPIESAHFVFRAKAEKDQLLAPYALDALEKAYAALTQDLGYQPTAKVRLEIYDSAEALARVSPLTVQDIKGSGTIALCKYNRLMATSPRALLRGYPWLDTMTHEFVHFLVTHKGRNTVPIWLQEGLAKFLETRWHGEPGKAIDPLQAEMLVRAAKKHELIPFAAMHPSIAKLPTQEKAALAFAEVEAAMRLLYQRGGQQALTELVAAMANGFSDERAVAQAYGKPFEQFESDWRAEVARPRPHAEALAARLGPHKLVFKEDAKGKSDDGDEGPAPEPVDPAAKKSARLGEIFFARHRWGPAALEYGKARAAMREQDPTLLRRQGFSLVQLRRPEEALEPLQLCVSLDREDSGAQVALADAFILLKRPREAYAPLQSAVEVDPFDERVHLLWDKAAQELHDEPVLQREKAALKTLGLVARADPGQSAPPAKDGALQSLPAAKGSVPGERGDKLSDEIEVTFGPPGDETKQDGAQGTPQSESKEAK